MIRNRFITGVCLFAAMVSLAFTGAVWAAGPVTKGKTALVQVMTAEKQSISGISEVTGDVTATNTIVVRASVEGPIVFCPWREGDIVKKGEPLIKIHRPIYQADVQASKAALDVAQARFADLKAGARKEELAQAAERVRQLESCAGFTQIDAKRVEQLVKTGALPGENMEKARLASIKCETDLAASRERYQMLQKGATATDLAIQKALVQEARAKLAMAMARLDECTITAPFAGVVTKIDVRPGDLAVPRSPLLTLMETASIAVRFSVAESQSYLLNKNTPVVVSFDALPNQEYTAHIVRLYPEIDSQTRTRVVEAKVDSSTGLVPGMFTRVRLTVQTSEEEIVMPDRALLTTDSGETVAFVVENGLAKERRVTLGIERGSCIQVLEGIKPGDQVIVAGHEKIKNNAPVDEIPLQGSVPCFASPGKGLEP